MENTIYTYLTVTIFAIGALGLLAYFFDRGLRPLLLASIELKMLELAENVEKVQPTDDSELNDLSVLHRSIASNASNLDGINRDSLMLDSEAERKFSAEMDEHMKNHPNPQLKALSAEYTKYHSLAFALNEWRIFFILLVIFFVPVLIGVLLLHAATSVKSALSSSVFSVLPKDVRHPVYLQTGH